MSATGGFGGATLRSSLSSLILSKSPLRVSLLSSRIFLKSLLSALSFATSVLTSVLIAVEMSVFTSVETSLLADAVAKKARVERVKMAMNLDFMIFP